MIKEEGGEEQFLFGPPHGVEKIQNVHRNYIQPKLGQHIEFYAKKMREQYIRDGMWPETKIFLDAKRARQPNDTLQNLMANKEVAAVINGRDEFDDLDLVFPHRTPYTIRKSDHGMV